MVRTGVKMLITAVLLTAVVAPQSVEADFLLRRVDLEKTVRIRFPLERVIFLVDSGAGDLSSYNGEYVELPMPQSRFDQSRLWLVTTRLDVPYQVDTINFGVLLLGAEGELVFVPPEKDPLPVESFSEASVAQLRNELLEEQERLLQLKRAFDQQDSEFQALQAKVDKMAGGGELSRLTAEQRVIESRIQRLSLDIAALEASLEVLKREPEPAAVAQQERQLSQQVSELAEAARQAESQEVQRRAQAEIDQQDKLFMLEQAADQSIEQLQQELETLRQRRVNIRRERGDQ